MSWGVLSQSQQLRTLKVTAAMTGIQAISQASKLHFLCPHSAGFTDMQDEGLRWLWQLVTRVSKDTQVRQHVTGLSFHARQPQQLVFTSLQSFITLK